MEPAAPPTVFGTIRRMTFPVRILMVGTFVNTLGSFLMLFLTLYLIEKGLSPYYAGIALGAWGVGRIIGAFIGGEIADRLGYRATMVFSMLGTAALMVGLIGAANIGNPWLVVAAALLAASIGGIWRPPAAAMMTELTPREQLVMVNAIWRLTFNAGMFAAPIFGALLSQYSWDLLFWVEAGSSALFGLFILTALPSDSRRAAPETGTAGPGAEPVGAPDALADPVPAPVRTTYMRVLSDGRFSLFLFAMLANAIVYIQAPSVLGPHLKSLGYATVVFGSLASLNALMVITLEVPLTKLTQRWPARTAIALGMALTGAGLSLYSLPLGLLGFVAATVVWTMGEVTASPSMLAYPGLVAPAHMRARYLAAATVANQAGYSIGPAVGVAVWNNVGGSVFWMAGVLSAVAIAAVLAGTRRVSMIEESAAVPAAATDARPEESPQPA